MFKILWMAFGLLDNFTETIDKLCKINTRVLFMNALTISILSIGGVLLGQLLFSDNSPHYIFFQLISNYIMSFIYLSILLGTVSFLFYKINNVQYIALYLLSDFPLLGALPLLIIGYSFSIVQIATNILITFLWACAIALKLKVFMKYFNASFSQALLTHALPFILVTTLGIATFISFFNQIASSVSNSF